MKKQEAVNKMLDKASFAMYMVDKTYQKSPDPSEVVCSVDSLINLMKECGVNESVLASTHQVLAACYEYKLLCEAQPDAFNQMKEWVIKKLRNACSCAAMGVGYSMFVSEINSPMHAIFIPSDRVRGNVTVL